MAIKMDGQLFVVAQYTHVTPGNLRAFVQVKLRNVQTGSYVEKRLRSGEEVERIDLDRRDMEYLYSDTSGHVFMDTQSYDQVHLSDEMLGEALKYLKPNTTVNALVHEDKVISIELPQTVDLMVKETPPVATGATVTNQLKEAELETGLKVRVPQFIVIGEMVRVKTEDGSYLGRAKD
jgi:elongation factor P